MKKNLIYRVVAGLAIALGTICLWSQTVSYQVEGKVTEAGKPIPNAQVVFTAETGRVFKLKTDKKGDFVIVGVQGGNYELEIIDSSGEKLFKKKTSVPAPDSQVSGQVVTLNIDISEKKPGASGGSEQAGQGGQGTQGGQQQPKYTKEQIAEMQKSNEKIMAAKPLVEQAQNAMNAKNWQDAITPLQQLVTMDPTNWQYYSALGDSYLYTGQYEQAVDTYEKGIQAADAMTTVDPKNPITDPAKKKVGEAKMLTNEGNAYLKLKKNPEAVAAYTKAASMDPNPATAYFNLCATQYNTSNTEGALQACDKAIAADPNRADAYFIKGSLLFGSGTMDKDGVFKAPPGTAEALNKYLELQPDGPHAKDVKDLLASIGAKVETTYKKKGK